MKYIATIILSLFITIGTFAQPGTQVDYEDDYGPATCTYQGVVNGKYSYRDAGEEIEISWTGTRWQIYYETDLLYHSDVVTLLNPPNYTMGNWQMSSLHGGVLESLSGNGTTAIPLPVEMVSFDVKKTGDKALLRWVTGTEINNDYFEVERSTDGVNFETIGKVEGAGTTQNEQKYQFEDADIYIADVLYYRLRQVDMDGAFDYSEIKYIGGIELQKESIVIYPNPVVDILTLELDASLMDNPKLLCNIYTQEGRLVLTTQLPIDKTVDVSSLKKGAYILEVVDRNKTYVQSFLKSE